MGNICFMGTSGYERAYHREYDTTAMSKEIVKNEVLFKQIDQKLQERRKEKTSWDSIFKSHNVIVKYIGENAKKVLQETSFIYNRNAFLSDVSYSILPSKSQMLFPTYSAREEYKSEVMKLFGCTVSMDQGYGNEYNELLGLMYQYLYLAETDKDARKTFEDINLAGKLKLAKKFLKDKNILSDFPPYFDVLYCDSIFRTLQSYSSFDAALQLIDRIDTDKEGVLNFIKQMGENPRHIEEMVKDNGINTYHYYSFRKVLEKRKNKNYID